MAAPIFSSEEFASERWIAIPNYDGLYEISNLGRVRRLIYINGKVNRKLEIPTMVKIIYHKNGYAGLSLSKNGVREYASIHRMVATAFLGGCPEGMECAHLDGNMHNHRLNNLRWVTRKENHSHKWLHGTAQAGEKQGNNQYSEKMVMAIRLMHYLGSSIDEVSTVFGLSYSSTHQLIRRDWKHIVNPLEESRKERDQLRSQLEQAQKQNEVYREALESIRYQSQFWDLSTTRERLRLQLGLCTVETTKALNSTPAPSGRIEALEEVASKAQTFLAEMVDMYGPGISTNAFGLNEALQKLSEASK